MVVIGSSSEEDEELLLLLLLSLSSSSVMIVILPEVLLLDRLLDLDLDLLLALLAARVGKYLTTALEERLAGLLDLAFLAVLAIHLNEICLLFVSQHYFRQLIV